MTTGTLYIHRQHRRFGRTSGFTLLEILIVLVVLLIGILAILRLFPGGFLTVKRTGELTVAEAMVTQMLDAEKNTPNLPQSIVAAVPGPNGTLIPLLTVQPDDLTNVTDADLAQLTNGMAVLPTVLQATGSNPNYYFSDINRIRNIIGETAHVPIPSVANSVFGSVYFLNFGPVYNVFGTDPTTNLPDDSLDVYGAPLERIVQSSTGSNINGTNSPVAQLNYSSQYAIDYPNLMIAFMPRIRGNGSGTRTFLLNFSYYAASNATNAPTVRSVINYKIVVPDLPTTATNTQPIWQKIFPDGPGTDIHDSTFYQFKQDSDVVSRKFQLVTPTPVNDPTANNSSWSWSDDPYEYAWFSPQIGPTGSIANPGVLIFNPRDHDYLEQTSSGTQPLTVRVDYTILDNHIIHEDRTVPASAPFSVKLSLPFILSNGDVMPDQTTYNGLFQQNAIQQPTATPDVIIYDVNNGQEIGEFQSGTYTNKTAFADLGATLDTATGRINFDASKMTDGGTSLENATIRLFYRAQGEWGMQLQKAQASYSRIYQASDISLQNYALMQGYYLGNGQAGGGRQQRMYFPPSEAGKTVILGEYYVLATVNNTPVSKRFSNEAYRINADSSQFEAINGVNMTWIDLTSQHPEAAPPGGNNNQQGQNWLWDDTQTGQAVSSVQGGSVKARVIWRDASHWRKVDNDTLLPQSQ
jgi:prepilin-type N-terminal cleavage/methylation domain-containing protein